MLIQLLTQHPGALPTVLKSTPGWVLGLFAGLLALGLSQARTREVSLVRMAVMPLAMVGLSLWGMVSAFGASPLFGWVVLAWIGCAAVMAALLAPRQLAAGTQYHAASRSFMVPGSLVPLALIMGIFLTKYVVGVDLAMQPALGHDGPYTLVVGALYGAFSGIFIGRALRLWRLVLRRDAAAPSASLSA